MRFSLAATLVISCFAPLASAQTCTGLACQQVSCPSGTTTVSGVVYAPNGTDPLPNVIVYVPNAPVDAFTAGVACPVPGTPPSGSPLVGATTGVDGSFTIPDMPVGTNIPLVIVSGRWRRQLVIPTVTSCTANPLPAGFASFPQNQSQGDIPKFAIATGSADSVECVLRKVGISDSEFTDPGGSGRINLFLASGSPGAQVDAYTPSATTLLSSAANLNAYDVLMLPCEGGVYTRTSAELNTLASFANAGGRVYASHYAYTWMDTPTTFSTVASWTNNSTTLPDGNATVNQGFSGGATLSTWLTEVGASTTPGQIAISTIRQTQKGVASSTEAWLTLNDLAAGNPVMQFVWDTPVGASTNQCGRVLFNEYHVENPTISSPGKNFPAECSPGVMTPQEKLLEYSLFELTNDGGAASLSPTTQDFGTQPVGFNSPTQTFIWTNNSTFAAGVTLLSASGDFNVVGNNCTTVQGGASCQIAVVFNPTAIGARTGVLTVGSNGTTLTATLTGTGIPDLSVSATTLTYGSIDVGATASQGITVTNAASGPVPVPPFVTTGDFSTTNNCGSTLAAGASCTVTVIFKPTTVGIRTGTLTVQSATPGAPSTMTGNGIDFTIVASPTSGTVIAGLNSATLISTTPLQSFANPLRLSCTTNAPARPAP